MSALYFTKVCHRDDLGFMLRDRRVAAAFQREMHSRPTAICHPVEEYGRACSRATRVGARSSRSDKLAYVSRRADGGLCVCCLQTSWCLG
jgi:hypothetical protein